ncbi:hypothetical protein ACFLRA_01350 [Bdellovibrionota bacterium]
MNYPHRVKMFFALVFVLSLSNLSVADDDFSTNPLYQKNSSFLHEPTLRPQFLETNSVTYSYYYPGDLFELTKTYDRNDLRTGELAVVRFERSLKMNPAGLPEYDERVDQSEALSIIPSDVKSVFDVFLQFEIYPDIASRYFQVSYPIEKEELEEAGIQTEENEIYQYNLFLLDIPVISRIIPGLTPLYQTVIRYFHTDHLREFTTEENIRRRYKQKLISFELMPSNFFTPRLRKPGELGYSPEEARLRNEVNYEMNANHGYMIFEPLIINEIPLGKFDQWNQETEEWEPRHAVDPNGNPMYETILSGISYLITNVPFPNIQYPKQRMVELTTAEFLNGLKEALAEDDEETFNVPSSDSSISPCEHKLHKRKRKTTTPSKTPISSPRSTSEVQR